MRLFEKIETKDFSECDIDVVLKIQNELKSKGSYSFVCEKMFIDLLQEIKTSGTLFGRIAYLGKEPVGFIFGDTQPKWYQAPECAWLIAIVVHPDYRRQGIGRRLLVEFLDKVRELGLKRICTIAEFTDEATLEFLRRMGFKRGRFVHLEKQI
ncbi:GNAT family N-acetyltransferase [Candidatus Chrysopegis kryptomonas]|uniref:Acetyltransferase (GNAT) family protein n=1 Tax=Candidatus Chryseopegocella kryptomonas TaxID=1633643 RepID=A0A0P1NZJ7_9BACT|nr:GNAT family N-acetyltransferase [Candidatus Chrysopegis kryptomonas]CUT04570.1 Acetyltransferase (GNAT) family protein [Candidatus Chrysopegis kryptomonas]